jgi:hypothetical protein
MPDLLLVQYERTGSASEWHLVCFLHCRDQPVTMPVDALRASPYEKGLYFVGGTVGTAQWQVGYLAAHLGLQGPIDPAGALPRCRSAPTTLLKCVLDHGRVVELRCCQQRAREGGRHPQYRSPHDNASALLALGAFSPG